MDGRRNTTAITLRIQTTRTVDVHVVAAIKQTSKYKFRCDLCLQEIGANVEHISVLSDDSGVFRFHTSCFKGELTNVTLE